MKSLHNITLVSGNWVAPELSVKALKYSMRELSFKEVLLFSHECPDNLSPEINFIRTEKLTHGLSSWWSMKELVKYISTDFCLLIHDDGFVINPHLWRDEFLEYDYIGAPWENFGGAPRVGNGGFCLKSKKFLEIQQTIPYTPGDHDDSLVCHRYPHVFIEKGCKFAPLEIAMKFSLETKIPECEYNLNNCFGFHGRGIIDRVHQGEGQQFIDRIKLLDEV